MLNALRLLGEDLREKARWCYKSDSPRAVVKVLATDGTLAMVLYRLMQGSRSETASSGVERSSAPASSSSTRTEW